jgi:Flp pilus assembly CpaF family ATPase
LPDSTLDTTPTGMRITVAVSSMKDEAPKIFGLATGNIYKVGRAKDSFIHLPSGLISSHHLDLHVTDDLQLVVKRRGINDVFVIRQGGGDELLPIAKTELLMAGDSIRLDPFQITFVPIKDKVKQEEDKRQVLHRNWYELGNAMHKELMNLLRGEYGSIFSVEIRDTDLIESMIKLSDEHVLKMDKQLLQYRFTSVLSMWLLQICYTGKPHGVNTELLSAAESTSIAQVCRRLTALSANLAAVEDVDENVIETAITSCRLELEPYQTLIASYGCRKYLWDRARGLGNLQELIDDPLITEIMVNSASQIYVERAGRIKPIITTLGSEDESKRILEKVVEPIGRHVDYSSPIVDARLKTMRVNAILDNIALGGTSITIRKFTGRPLTAKDLEERGSISPAVSAFLGACIQAKKNTLIYGGTGTGKTTLLNILATFIPSGERVVTIEDSAELQLGQANLVRLEGRPSNVEGQGRISIRDLVRNALRMRPDRIIVGECRGAEAFDMLQAMSTGHPGSMSTAHANTPVDLFMRLEAMCLEAFELPVSAIREQIASALNIIVELQRRPAGHRVISRVSEIIGIGPTSGRVVTQDIFVLREKDLQQPRWLNTGYVPSFFETLLEKKLITLEDFATC